MTPFNVEAIKTFDGATVPGKIYTVIATCNDGQEWYKVGKSENGYTWIPAHVFKRIDS